MPPIRTEKMNAASIGGFTRTAANAPPRKRRHRRRLPLWIRLSRFHYFNK